VTFGSRLRSRGTIANGAKPISFVEIRDGFCFPAGGGWPPGWSTENEEITAVTLAMMVELESTDIKVNLVSPGFSSQRSQDTHPGEGGG
jgi:hypothetical protein